MAYRPYCAQAFRDVADGITPGILSFFLSCWPHIPQLLGESFEEIVTLNFDKGIVLYMAVLQHRIYCSSIQWEEASIVEILDAEERLIGPIHNFSFFLSFPFLRK